MTMWTSTGTRKSTTTLDVLILCYPLAAAIRNPGTGITSGFYAAIFVFVIMAFRHGLRARRVERVELFVLVSVFVILVSPLWTSTPEATNMSPTRGAAMSVLYVLPVRWVIRTREDFGLCAKVIASMCGAYAVYFVATAVALATSPGRLSVTFANANYTGAVLAFGAAVSLWIVSEERRLRLRIVFAAAYLVQAWAIYETGSRASFAGIGLATMALILCRARRAPRVVHGMTFVVLVCGFFIGFFPEASSLFRGLSEPLGGRTFSRDGSVIVSVSGRDWIWRETREVISQSWFVGWGPDRYRLHTADQSLSHSWGLEFVASVGVVGTFFLVVVMVLCYFGKGQPLAGILPRQAAMWNAATALSLLPNLVLSTHQWTLWAWAGIALWSASPVLIGGDGAADNQTGGQREGERPKPTPAVATAR